VLEGRRVVPATRDSTVFDIGREGLAQLLEELGQPRYRADQIVAWLYQRGVSSYDDMTDLPLELRERLSERLPLVRPEIVHTEVSALDATRKHLIRFADGIEVETVSLPSADRLTVCFSTQAGCGMGCEFCATGEGGLVRSLGAGEIAEQVRLAALHVGVRASNAVAMGQGEPFANYSSLMEGLRLLNAEDGLGIGARHITVSTCGLIPGIERFSREPEQFTLAVSLHSAIQDTRDRLMPGVKEMPLDALRGSLIEYVRSTGRRFSFEYALIAGVNDTQAEMEALAVYASGLLCHVNLIPANPVPGSSLSRSQRERVRAFARTLAAADVAVSVREERGADIDAACGQLKQRMDPN
jgi:23S rRNA (adenine2503-C2)-methyltransferase